MKNQMDLQAVKNNGLALKYVKEQTEAICLEAALSHGEVYKNYIN